MEARNLEMSLGGEGMDEEWKGNENRVGEYRSRNVQTSSRVVGMEK